MLFPAGRNLCSGNLPRETRNQKKMSMTSGPTGSTGARPRQPHRFITTNNGEGKAIFSTTLPEVPPSRDLPDGMRIAFCYGTNQTPPDFTDEKDIGAYESLIANPPGMVLPHGCVARLIDLPPGQETAMHRTISLNYNFLLQGEVELVLDSGETRRLMPGDMVVQRAVNHLWRNLSDTQWARWNAFGVPAIPDQKLALTESGTHGSVVECQEEAGETI
ncbi:Cupin domain-containing protein [Cladophialophora immunda]|nr:Cupin domain-containing protein [Cladophialophora immunda]